MKNLIKQVYQFRNWLVEGCEVEKIEVMDTLLNEIEDLEGDYCNSLVSDYADEFDRLAREAGYEWTYKK